ncbi:hypothetical protein pb186bvf_018503 [Paramecium bursaria]
MGHFYPFESNIQQFMIHKQFIENALNSHPDIILNSQSRKDAAYFLDSPWEQKFLPLMSHQQLQPS